MLLRLSSIDVSKCLLMQNRPVSASLLGRGIGSISCNPLLIGPQSFRVCFNLDHLACYK